MPPVPINETPIPQNEDPFTTINQWLNEATKSEPNDPEAMSLATVDKDGLPNVRTLLLKGIDPDGTRERGLVFYTNFESAKGRELETCPRAAMLFYWKSLGRQIRIRGTITSVSDEEADAYFMSRPEGSRIGAWASDQSRVLASREILETRVAEFTEKFSGREIPRPPHWSGYRLTPVEIEFWMNGPYRLHHRLLYKRTDPSQTWALENLFP